MALRGLDPLMSKSTAHSYGLRRRKRRHINWRSVFVIAIWTYEPFREHETQVAHHLAARTSPLVTPRHHPLPHRSPHEGQLHGSEVVLSFGDRRDTDDLR
jgi:hypothetical protein